MGKFADEYDKIIKGEAKRKNEQENPYMLITGNAEGKPDTLRFKTPNALEEYKRKMYSPRTMTKEERAAARVQTQNWLSDDPQRNITPVWQGTHQATQDSVTIDLKKKPEDQLKAKENARKLHKLSIEEKYNKYGAKALTDPEGREMFGEKWEDMKKKQAGPAPEQKILDLNKKINEIDKNMVVKEKDAKGREQEYVNPNFNDQAITTLENRKTALKDSINIEVKNVKFKRFADTWGVDTELLKTQYNNAKAEIAKQLTGNPANPQVREQLAEQIAQKYGFTLESLRAMDDELVGGR